MENEQYSTRKEALEIRDIILEHIRAILIISRIEFRGGFWENVSRGDSRTESVYVPDTRASYIQSIRALHDVLLPYFDKKMKEKSKELEGAIEKEHARLKKKQKEDMKDTNYREKLSVFKSTKMREMFQELNLLMYRQKYLKSAIYSEGDEAELLEEDKAEAMEKDKDD